MGMYVCGPTVYRAPTSATRARTSSSRGCARWLRLRGYEVTLVHNITDVNDKIYDAAPGASAARAVEATEWYLEDVGRFGLHEVDHFPKVTETMDEIVAFIADLIERGLAYEVEGDVYFRVVELARATGGSRAAARSGRGAGAERAQGGSARLRALEGEQARRGHVVGVAVGPRPAGLAHRVLGDGREAPRAGLRDPRRRARPRLPAPRERARPVAARSATDSRASGCTTACSASPARRCRSPSATSRRSRKRSTAGGARRLLVFFLTAHWRKPIDYSEETMAAARSARRAGFREVFRAPSLPAAGGAWQRFDAALEDDFNTPEALAVLHEWRDHDLLRRGLGVFGLETLAESEQAPARARRPRCRR